MTQQKPSLDTLRQQIDDLDAQIHDALMRRAALAPQIAAAKGGLNGALAMRPGREAVLLRERLARHQGPMPPAVIARIWREIVNGLTALQSPFSIAVCAPEKSVGYWDLARNHFGAAAPMRLHRSAMVVLEAVSQQPRTLGLLPLPMDGEQEPWWTGFGTAQESERAHIIWKLPFFTSESGQFEDLTAFVIAHAAPEATGDDVTVLTLETDLDTSRARIGDRMADEGLSTQFVAIREDSFAGTRTLLAEVDGFLTADDERLERAVAALGDQPARLAILGAYPRPLS